MKKIVYVITYLCIVISCSERQDYKEALNHAQSIMEEFPDSSLAILDTLGRHSDVFDNHFRMQYLLTLTYSQAKTGLKFENDSTTKLLVSHFDDDGNCTEKALAYYSNDDEQH